MSVTVKPAYADLDKRITKLNKEIYDDLKQILPISEEQPELLDDMQKMPKNSSRNEDAIFLKAFVSKYKLNVNDNFNNQKVLETMFKEMPRRLLPDYPGIAPKNFYNKTFKTTGKKIEERDALIKERDALSVMPGGRRIKRNRTKRNRTKRNR